MFRNHEHILKPKRPLISNSLSNALHIPVLITTVVKQPVASSPPSVKFPTMTDGDLYYDAADHFSDDDFDEEQAPEDDVSNMVVKFHPLTVWNNSEDNTVEYVLPPGFGEWIFNKI